MKIPLFFLGFVSIVACSAIPKYAYDDEVGGEADAEAPTDEAGEPIPPGDDAAAPPTPTTPPTPEGCPGTVPPYAVSCCGSVPCAGPECATQCPACAVACAKKGDVCCARKMGNVQCRPAANPKCE